MSFVEADTVDPSQVPSTSRNETGQLDQNESAFTAVWLQREQGSRRPTPPIDDSKFVPQLTFDMTYQQEG